jgi:hypothetical protein
MGEKYRLTETSNKAKNIFEKFEIEIPDEINLAIKRAEYRIYNFQLINDTITEWAIYLSQEIIR